MEYSKSLVLLCMLYFLIINGIESVNVRIQIYPDKEGIVEGSNLQLKCHSTPESGERVYGITIQDAINNVFENIASFHSNGDDPSFQPGRTHLSLRANLSNPTAPLLNTVTLTFYQIECEDEREYRCQLVMQLANGHYSTETSDNTSIIVKSKPAKPDNAPTWIPDREIEEGTDVTFTCTGNVGNPAGTFIWTKIRGCKSDTHHGITTNTAEMPDSCTFTGTSEWTTKLEAEDNNASIKCQVEQKFATSDMFKQSRSEDLVVYYRVRNIEIKKSPNLTTYAEGATSIKLECSAEGNPSPTFTWYKDSDVNTTLETGKTFILLKNDVKITGNYCCVGQNKFKEKQHEQKAYQYIQIVTKDPQTNNEEPSLSTGGVVGIVVGLLCAIAATLVM